MERAMAPNTVNREVNNMVTFMSWNSTGFNTVKSEWFNNILNEKNVMFCSTQEHLKQHRMVISSSKLTLETSLDMWCLLCDLLDKIVAEQVVVLPSLQGML